MASGFVPVTGVAAAYAACCSVTDVCTNLLFNVAPSLAARKKQSGSHLIALLSESACQNPNLQPRYYTQPCSFLSRRDKPHRSS